MVLGSTQPLIEMIARDITWGVRSGRCVGITTFPPACFECLKILGVCISWRTLSQSRPVQRWLCFLLLRKNYQARVLPQVKDSILTVSSPPPRPPYFVTMICDTDPYDVRPGLCFPIYSRGSYFLRCIFIHLHGISIYLLCLFWVLNVVITIILMMMMMMITTCRCI